MWQPHSKVSKPSPAHLITAFLFTHIEKDDRVEILALALRTGSLDRSLVPPFTSWIMLGKLFYLSLLQFSHLKNEDNNSTSFVRLLEDLKSHTCKAVSMEPHT